MKVLALGGAYEEALTLLAAFPTAASPPTPMKGLARDSTIRIRKPILTADEERTLRRRYADVLLGKGQIESCLAQHVAAGTPILEVLELFPELLLREQRGGMGGVDLQGSRTPSSTMHRSASALASYIEQYRPAVRSTDEKRVECGWEKGLGAGQGECGWEKGWV